MNEEFARLAHAWEKWGLLAGLTSLTWSSKEDERAARFQSDDETVDLSISDDGWWTIDRTNDRGKRYVAVAKFTELQLASKYLIWNWASTARSAQGLTLKDPELYSLGVAQGVVISATNRNGYFEIEAPSGVAVLPEPYATIFSHVMNFSVEQIDQIVGVGLS